MNVKKVITRTASIVFLIALGLSVYISSQKHLNPPIEPYQHLSVENIIDKCDAPEMLVPISAFSFPMDGVMGKHKNCLGIDTLLVVAWKGSDSELHITAAKLIALMYADFESTQRQGIYISVSLLKLMPRDIRGVSEKSFVAFYEIKEEKSIASSVEDKEIGKKL